MAVGNQALKLCPVTPDDCRTIWEWANDPVTREKSFYSAHIDWDVHRQWFRARLEDDNCSFYIVRDEHDLAVGQIRFEIDGDTAVVSVSVAQDQRGRGLGSPIISLGSSHLFNECKMVTVIYAYIKGGNEASVKVFRRSGYEIAEIVEINGSPAIRMDLQRDSAG